MFPKIFLTACWVSVLCAGLAHADVPLGGFIPLVGIGLTDEFKNANTDLTGTFFLADPEPSLVGNPLSGGSSPYYDIALLDTGAATHILTPAAAGANGFDIAGNDFAGTQVQQIGGATGLINLNINDPLAVFAAGLGNRTANEMQLSMDTSALRGQSSVATLSALSEWTLPNILGLPMAAHHAIHVKNSAPQVFDFQGRTVRTPQVDFLDLGTGSQLGISRRTDLKIRPGASFIAGPLYVQSLDIFGGEPFHENPLSPTVVENGALFVDVDMHHGAQALNDTEFLFDTGADLTVVSQLTAVRLGFDPVLDTPDFVLEVEGSGGISSGIPGFYVDTLTIDAVGGSFTKQRVPLAVLDVTNPNDPGNIIDGILGMHLFTDRDLVIDANPSVGQGGAGPSLYISDPVTESHAWAAATEAAAWDAPQSWSAPGIPNSMWVTQVSNLTGSPQTAQVTADSTVYQLTISGNTPMTVEVQDGATLRTYGATNIDAGGRLWLRGNEAKIDAQFIHLEQGTLTGSGELFVGTGPVTGAVRNVSGRIEPGDPLGLLEIRGDLSNLAEGTLALELGGTVAETEYDQISAERFAFLAGTLEITLTTDFRPEVGDMFTVLTAAAGVVGEFEELLLPQNFHWTIDYQPQSVVLEVVGLEGDFNGDGRVDGDDLAAWKSGYGTDYDGCDFLAWQLNFQGGTVASAAAVPEPTGGLLLWIGLAIVLPCGGGQVLRRIEISKNACQNRHDQATARQAQHERGHGKYYQTGELGRGNRKRLAQHRASLLQ